MTEAAASTISIVPSVNRHSLMVAVDSATSSGENLETGLMKKNSNKNMIADQAISIMIEDYQVPTYRRLLLFCSTTFLIWLSEPLLSLVDTTVVGLTQGSKSVIQLASLGPATTLIDSIFYMTYFLAIATTNQIAAQLAVKDYRTLQKTFSNVMGVAVVLGLMCTLFVFTFAKPMITNMAGLSGTPELIAFATKYAYIRASVAVVSVTAMTMQAMCLASLNTKTPSIAVLAASLTNVVGDIALRQYGVIGAAVATAASTVISGSILFIAVRKTFRRWREKELIAFDKNQQVESAVPTASQSSINGAISTIENDQKQNPNILAVDSFDKDGSVPLLSRAELKAETADPSNMPASTTKNPRPIPFISLPGRKAALKLLLLSGPIFFVIISKIACYSAMTLRCTDFGVEALAAHSIMMRIFFFYGCFGDSVSQTAQSFLPSTLYPTPNPKNFRAILQKLIIMAASIGFLNRLGTINILKHFGKYLTKDATIVRLMSENTQFIGFAILLHPMIVLLEGTVIASRDFATLIKTYATTLPLHFFILRGFCGSFPAIWRTFFLFQTIRFVLYGIRVSRKQAAIIEEERKALAAI
jgi:Na+-driven multidrug efflux pump